MGAQGQWKWWQTGLNASKKEKDYWSCNGKKDIFKVRHSWFQSSAKGKVSHVIAGGGAGVPLTDEHRGQGQGSNQQAARVTWPAQIRSVEFQISLNPLGISFKCCVYCCAPVLERPGVCEWEGFQTLLPPAQEGKEISTPLHYVASFLLPPSRGQPVFIMTCLMDDSSVIQTCVLI